MGLYLWVIDGVENCKRGTDFRSIDVTQRNICMYQTPKHHFLLDNVSEWDPASVWSTGSVLGNRTNWSHIEEISFVLLLRNKQAYQNTNEI